MRLKTEDAMEKYRDNVFAAAFSILKNPDDADDIVQETFLAYHRETKDFESEEHIRAWLLRVAINKAKNESRKLFRRARVPLEEYMETLIFETPAAENLFEEVMKLPSKYRIVLHLFYYEDYPVKDISAMLGVSESNVKVRLNRGRKLLKGLLEEEE